MFYDELKKVSIASIEEAIGRAVSELTGAAFVCTVSGMDLSNIDGARLEIFIAPPQDFDLDEGAHAG